MTEAVQHKVSLGVFAGLIGVILALCLGLTPAPAQAADSTQSSFELGGLVFTTEQAPGTTTTTVNIAPETGIVTISGGNANFTVTQQIQASVKAATQIQIGTGSLAGNYSGTITLNDVVLTNTGASVLVFNNAAWSDAKTKTGATVILGEGTTLTGGTDPTIQMSNANAQVYDTLTVNSGAQVIGKDITAIAVGKAGEAAGAETLNLAGGTIVGGAVDNTAANATAAITFAGNAGSLAINVDAATSVQGNSGDGSDGGAGAAGAPALSVNNTGAIAEKNNTNFVQIAGDADLQLIAGNSVLTSGNAATAGNPGVVITQGLVSFDGTSALTVQGGRGSDTTSNAVDVAVGATGGSGIALGGDEAATFTVNAGTLNVYGGVGGSANATNTTENNITGADGGIGIEVADVEGNALNFYGGTINVTGGNGGNGSNVDNGKQGAGGIGIGNDAETVENEPTLNIAKASSVSGAAAPTVTVVGGMGGFTNNEEGTPDTPAFASQAINNIQEDGAGILPAQGTNGKSDWYPWVAYGTTTGVAPTAEVTGNGTLLGFAGMFGATADGGSDGQYQAMQKAIVNAEETDVVYKYVRFQPAPVSGYQTGVVVADSPNPIAPYVMAETSMVGLLPNTDYTYVPTIGAEFEGIENVNTSNFAELLTGNPIIASTEVDIDDVTFAPAANVGTQVGEDYFYIVPGAEGNQLTVTLPNTALEALGKDFTDMYPGLTTIDPITLPVVYTITVKDGVDGGYIGAGVANASTPDGTANVVYTNPNGNGTLVYAEEGSVPALLDPETIEPLQTIVVTEADSDAEFIGLFDETATPYEQVNNNQINGWTANATLTAEWGTIALQSVLPTPTDVQQGQSTTVAATYTIDPNNNAIDAYSLYASGLTADWQDIFVSAQVGSGQANGLTVEQTGGSTATGSQPFTVTSEATVAANATADVGSYRVWPAMGNNGFDGVTLTGKPVYGVVNVSGELGGGTVTVVRLSNPNTGEHFYSTDANEIRYLDTVAGWDNEGVAWVGPVQSQVPIFRLYNPNNGAHMYTVSSTEYNGLQRAGWNGEGEKLYSAGSDGVPIYRMYNPLMTENGGAYAHLWTGDFNEYTVLAANHSWKQEGTAWFAVSLDEE